MYNKWDSKNNFQRVGSGCLILSNKITYEILYKYIDKLFIIIYYNGVVIIYVLLKGENK